MGCPNQKGSMVGWLQLLLSTEGCEASPSPPDWLGGTRPSPPAHQSEGGVLRRQRRSEEKQGGHQEAQIPRSEGVGPSTCRTAWRGSHRLEQVQSGSDHQGSCRTRCCCCKLLFLLPSCFHAFQQSQYQKKKF